MLDGRLVTPRDLVARQPKDTCHTVTLGRARRPAAQDNRQDALLVQAGTFRQLFVIDLLLLAQIADALVPFHAISLGYYRLRASAELRPVSVHVVDFLRVSPDYFRRLQSESLGQALTLLGARRVTAVDDGVEDLSLYARGSEQVVDADLSIIHPVNQRPGPCHGASLRQHFAHSSFQSNHILGQSVKSRINFT
jgi:hypothetical protein